MTQSLTERLQARHAAQMAEIEALTSAELKKLAENLRSASRAELISMHDDIHEMSAKLRSDITTVSAFARWWWVALIATWVMMGGLWAWHSLSNPTPPQGIAQYQRFWFEGRTYLMLPEGTEVITCRSEGQVMPCAALPMPE